MLSKLLLINHGNAFFVYYIQIQPLFLIVRNVFYKILYCEMKIKYILRCKIIPPLKGMLHLQCRSAYL